MPRDIILFAVLALLSPLCVSVLLLLWRRRGRDARQARQRLEAERWDRTRYP